VTTAIDRTDVFHPVAEIFPMMSDREFLDLVADIREHGLREPVWLHRDGRVIDGRNRFLACQDTGVAVLTRTYDGDDAELIEFVISLNLHRRHLNESQRAMVAARVANLRPGRPSENPANLPGFSQADAAAQLQVSERSVRDAKKVQERAVPELAARVEAGEISVSTAAVVAEAAPEVQRKLANGGKKAVAQGAKEIQQDKRAAAAADPKPERKQNRRPITDAFRDATYDAIKAVERLERLVADDRFTRNAEQVARMSRGDLLRAADLLATVIDRIPNLTKETTE
jgi:hypothetical protein